MLCWCHHYWRSWCYLYGQQIVGIQAGASGLLLVCWAELSSRSLKKDAGGWNREKVCLTTKSLKELRIQLLMIDDKLNHVFSMLSFSGISGNSGSLSLPHFANLFKSSSTYFWAPSLPLVSLSCGTGSGRQTGCGKHRFCILFALPSKLSLLAHFLP